MTDRRILATTLGIMTYFAVIFFVSIPVQEDQKDPVMTFCTFVFGYILAMLIYTMVDKKWFF